MNLGSIILLGLLSGLLVSYVYSKYILFKRYNNILSERERLLKIQRSKITELRVLQKKEKALNEIQQSVLKEHIEKLQKENILNNENKLALAATTKAILSHMIIVNNYLFVKNATIEKQLEYIDPEELTENDKQFYTSLKGELQFFDSLIKSLNQYHFEVTGEMFVVKYDDPVIIKNNTLINLSKRENRN